MRRCRQRDYLPAALLAGFAFAGILRKRTTTNGAVGHNKPQQQACLLRWPAVDSIKPQLPLSNVSGIAGRQGRQAHAEQLRAKYALTDEQDNALHALSLEAAQ